MLTDAGAYGLSDSPYGTYDQGGNVWEWNEADRGRLDTGASGAGAGTSVPATLAASYRNYNGAPSEGNDVGFRVASLVPEPGTGLLVMSGVLGLALRRKRTAKAL